MTKQQIITAASQILWDQGVRILEGNRLADTDEAHVDELVRHMGLNGEHRIVDMGCGFGEVSRLLAKKQKAHFYLINNDEFQLSKCPHEDAFSIFCKDMCSTGFISGWADLVMFNYSLCLVDADVALKEAARISTSTGNLFVYDYERIRGDNVLSRQYLFAEFLSDSDFRLLCEKTGWRDVETIHPGGDDSSFRKALSNDEVYDNIFDDLTPVIRKARR